MSLSNKQPTNKLRFVKRRIPVSTGDFSCRTKTQEVKVLQQWWAHGVVQMGWGDLEVGPGEWRDVELVDDDSNES